MCGITGILSSRQSKVDPALIQRMMEQIAHRGPDDSGVYQSGTVTLGFRRLSIVDLKDGHQPMVSQGSRYAIVFNGEIYNFRELRTELEKDYQRHFLTRSDTEVALQAFETWGPDCFERFNGMFAIAIWDNASQQLYLARDRSGKKPLFTFEAQGQLLFASEVKALRAHPDFSVQPDPARIAAGIAYRYVPGSETLFGGVNVIPAGHWASVTPDNLRPKSEAFWTCNVPARTTTGPLKTVAAATEKLRRLLTESVDRRLVADVPVGAFLSGGIDSSLIVALMAARVKVPLNTFSIGFDTGFSEHNYARKVAEQFETRHHELIVNAADLIKEIPAVLWHRETPISEPSDIPLFMLAREARKHVTVVLSGEGSDELFAGYPKYLAEHYCSKFPGRQLRRLAPAIKAALRKKNGSSSPLALALASLSEPDRYDSMARWFGAFGSQERHELISPCGPLDGADPHAFAREIARANAGLSPVAMMQFQDYSHWLPANLLLRGDRLTMAHSLELRCPFLDPNLVDFAFRDLPDKFEIRNGTGKWIVRHMAGGLLPAEIINRKKWGFKVPVAEWFRAPLKDTLKQTLLSAPAMSRGYFNQSEIQRLVTEHTEHGANHSKQLWYLFQLELWHLMFVDGTLKSTDELV